MLTTGHYKREHERYEVNLPLILETGASRVVARSKNLSAGGASIALVDFIESEDLDDEGSITIRSQSGDLQTPYEITYRKENVIGIRFSGVTPKQSEYLNQILETLPLDGSVASTSVIDQVSKRKSKPSITLRTRLWIAVRVTGFLTVNMLWPLLRRVVRPKVVFAVYGTRGDQRTYIPDWLMRICPPVVALAYIKDKTSPGVMVSSPYSEEELATDSNKVRKYITDLRKEFPKVNRFALVGRLPGFSMKAGVDILPPLVDGSLGTRFAMYESAMQIASKLEEATAITLSSDFKSNSWTSSIAVLGGAGRIGSKLIDDLCKQFQTVIAIDPRYVEERQELLHGSTVIYTKRGERLKGTRLALVLTARGDDILPIVEHFEAGTVIADDTHPCMKRPIRKMLHKQGVDVWKTVVTSSEYGMYPRMPNFRNDNIPGCLLEALVLNAKGDDVLDSPEIFFEAAKTCGYKTLLIRHPDDS